LILPVNKIDALVAGITRDEIQKMPQAYR